MAKKKAATQAVEAASAFGSRFRFIIGFGDTFHQEQLNDAAAEGYAVLFMSVRNDGSIVVLLELP
jgi:hypothetical protein